LRVAGWGGCQDSCREVELRGRHSTLLGGASGTEKKLKKVTIKRFLEIELSSMVTTSCWVAKQQVHCNENSIYLFLFWELSGLSPNFHIHVSVSEQFTYCQDRSTYLAAAK
jgi:hypothetical protein